MQTPSSVASISTFYDRLGKPVTNMSVLKIMNGHLVDEQGETAVAILMRPQELAEGFVKGGLKLVEFTDRSGNTVWVNPLLVTKVRAGARATIVEQGGVDRLPWDPIQVRETVKAVRERLPPLAAPQREVALAE